MFDLQGWTDRNYTDCATCGKCVARVKLSTERNCDHCCQVRNGAARIRPISRKRALRSLYQAGLVRLAREVETMTDAGWKVAQIRTVNVLDLPIQEPVSSQEITADTRRTEITTETAPTRYQPVIEGGVS